VEQPIGKRIIVVGNSNAGKSTLAQQLAERLGVPFIELDALYHGPNWTPAEPEVMRAAVRRAIEPESWVMAGNYLDAQQEVSWPVADTIVWLDLSLPKVLRRAVVRSWRRWRTQEDLWGTGNRENFWEHLMLWSTDKSLFAHMIKTHRDRQRYFAAFMRDPRWAHLTFIHLRSQQEVERLLAATPAQSSGTAHAEPGRIQDSSLPTQGTASLQEITAIEES